VYERQKAKALGDCSLSHPRWSGGRSCPGKREVERCYSAVRYTMVNRSRRIRYMGENPMGEGSRTQVERGNGIPKERKVDKRRDVCEWEG
jgi:hypothetical protein